jgi:hypothetical protein
MNLLFDYNVVGDEQETVEIFEGEVQVLTITGRVSDEFLTGVSQILDEIGWENDGTAEVTDFPSVQRYIKNFHKLALERAKL